MRIFWKLVPESMSQKLKMPNLDVKKSMNRWWKFSIVKSQLGGNLEECAALVLKRSKNFLQCPQNTLFLLCIGY